MAVTSGESGDWEQAAREFGLFLEEVDAYVATISDDEIQRRLASLLRNHQATQEACGFDLTDEFRLK